MFAWWIVFIWIYLTIINNTVAVFPLNKVKPKLNLTQLQIKISRLIYGTLSSGRFHSINVPSEWGHANGSRLEPDHGWGGFPFD
jgi:hypothetical protein